jgi:hypothetical protein
MLREKRVFSQGALLRSRSSAPASTSLLRLTLELLQAAAAAARCMWGEGCERLYHWLERRGSGSGSRRMMSN